MYPFRRRPSGELDLGPGSARSETRLRVPSSRGQYVTRHGLVREVLLRYLSPILVDSVLDRAMHARNLTPNTLTDSGLSELTADIMVGLRLFVPETQLRQLMLDLAEILDAGHP